MEAKLLLIQALSPIHAGTGQGVGVIDQPIAREKATDIPFIPGSSLKGVFRDACPEADRIKIFGPDTNNADLHQGALTFADARLLLLPVRSLSGVFAWATSPLLIARLVRDAKEIAGITDLPKSVSIDKKSSLVAEKDSAVMMSLDNRNIVVLEDLELTAKPSKDVDELAKWLKTAFGLDSKERLCIVSDDVLSFLLETATEVTARIRLKDDTKTVEDGALWYEEALPVETVLVSIAVAANNSRIKPKEVFETVKPFTGKAMQFGGNATVGRGLCKVTFAIENSGEEKAGG